MKVLHPRHSKYSNGFEHELKDCVQEAPSVVEEADVYQITEFIRGRLTRHFRTEHNRKRKVPMHQVADTRVDICLYLLGPNQVSTMDVAALHAIGSCAPVVPLLAKVHFFPNCLEWI